MRLDYASRAAVEGHCPVNKGTRIRPPSSKIRVSDCAPLCGHSACHERTILFPPADRYASRSIARACSTIGSDRRDGLEAADRFSPPEIFFSLPALERENSRKVNRQLIVIDAVIESLTRKFIKHRDYMCRCYMAANGFGGIIDFRCSARSDSDCKMRDALRVPDTSARERFASPERSAGVI